MKVNFDYPTEQIQVSHGVLLKPGVNELPDEIAQSLIAGSEALVQSVAKAKGISEEDARKQLKGKGLSTAATSPATSSSTRKRREGGEG